MSGDISILASSITELRKCQVAVQEKDKLINERLSTYNGDSAPRIAWWQEPTMVVGGVSVSFLLGSLLVYYGVRGQ